MRATEVSDQRLDVRVLGPLEVIVAGHEVPLGGAKQRLVLATLAASPNTVVSADRLVDAVWGDAQPRSAHATLQKYVYRLRAALGRGGHGAEPSSVVQTRPGGYVLSLAPGDLDADRFTDLVDAAHRHAASGDAATAMALLTTALGLWRGTPAWVEFDDRGMFRGEVARLEGLRMAAIEDRIEVGLALGRHRELIGELEATTESFPLRERPRAQLMLALYRSGRQVEALRSYQAFRTYLNDELGLEPSEALQQLEQDIVLCKPHLDLVDVGRSSSPRPARDGPRTVALPPALQPGPGIFVGRAAELDWLAVLWARAVAGERSVALIWGSSGIGKTRLAAELASRAHADGVHVAYERAGLAPAEASRSSPDPMVDDGLSLIVIDDLDRVGADASPLICRLLSDAAMPSGTMVIGLAREQSVVDTVAADVRDHQVTYSVRALGGLDAEAVGMLVAPVMRPTTNAFVEALRAETGGNPALVLEVRDQLHDQEVAARLDRAMARVNGARLEVAALQDDIAAGVLARTWRESPERRGAPFRQADPAVTCPYKGLACFEAADARYFCGRERLVATLVARLAASRFVGVIGASGSGKSSLVRAGLIASLAMEALPGSECWPTIVLTPGANPLESLALSLARAANRPTSEVVAQLRDDPVALVDVTARLLHDRTNCRLVLIVDQFEELFTVCRDAQARAWFTAALVGAAEDPGGPIVVVVLRADYYGACAPYPLLAQALEDSQTLVGAMTDGELRRAVIEPAARAGLRVEEDVVTAVCREAAGEPGALPLISTALLETWVRRDGNTLTSMAYTDAGGVRGALAGLADRVYESFDPPDRAIARRLLMRLAEPGEGDDDVRRRAPRAELDSIDTGGAVLDRLIEHRLLTADGNTVEVAHEALLREWPCLRTWLEEDRSGRKLHRHLTDAAAAWAGARRDPAELYRGTRLVAAQEWIGSHPDHATAIETDFLDASTTAHESELRRARRTTRRLAAVLAVATLAAGLAAVQWHRATRQSARAGAAARTERLARLDATRQTTRADAAARTERSARLATLASTLQGQQLDVALLLGLEGQRYLPSTNTEGALEAALAHVPAGLDQIVHLDGSTSYNLGGLSPDGKLLAAPDADGTVQLRDLDSGSVTRTVPGPSPALAAYFSGDGALVAAGSRTGSVTVEDVTSGQRVGTPIVTSGTLVYGEFDPTNAARLFTISNDGDAILWDRSDVDHPRPLGSPFHFGYSFDIPVAPFASVSGDGRLLAIGSASTGQTLVWDIASHVVVDELPGWPGAFGPDASSLPTADGDHEEVWDARSGDGARSGPLTGLDGAYPHAVISRDGHRLAATDAARVMRVFDLDTGQVIGAPVALAGEGWPVGFLPDGRVITTTTAALYDVWRAGPTVGPAGVALGPGDGVQASFVRGGAEVVTVKDGGQVLGWDTATGAPIDRPPSGTEPLAAVSPDGALDAVRLADGGIGLRDHVGHEILGTLDGGRGGEVLAVWSPTGRLIATSTSVQACRFTTGPCGEAVGDQADQTVLLWDVSDPREPKVAARLDVPGTPPDGAASELFPVFSADDHDVAVIDKVLSALTVFDARSGEPRWSSRPGGQVIQAAFAPDGKTLAVAHLDAAGSGVTMFDERSGTPGPELDVNNIFGAAFARGGDVLITSSGMAGNATGMQLWDAATFDAIGEPMTSPGLLGLLVTPSPDGTKVVTGTGSGTTVLWDLDLDHWREGACRIAGRNLTRAEWQQYLPDEPYHQTCPRWPAED